MGTAGAISKVYLNEDGQGVRTCHQCRSQYPFHPSPYLPVSLDRALVKTRCKQCAGIVRFDCRSYPSIPVHVLGILVRLHPQAVVSTVQINAISLGGISFILTQDIPLTLGETFDIRFILDDDGPTVIQEAIVIRRIQEPCIEAEFAHHDTYRYELDFYISAHGGAFV
jgi:hypothetical protein